MNIARESAVVLRKKTGVAGTMNDRLHVGAQSRDFRRPKACARLSEIALDHFQAVVAGWYSQETLQSFCRQGHRLGCGRAQSPVVQLGTAGA